MADTQYTTGDLGRAVKQKYPGSYDSVDDATLGRAFKQKYPGSYDQFADAPSTPAGQGALTGGESGSFLSNVMASGGRLIGDVASAAMHPLNTAEALGQMPQGVLNKVLSIGANEQSTALVDAMIDHFKDRYGSLENVKKTLYEDPVGVMADLASVAGGAGLAAKGVSLTADVAKAADVARTASTVADVANTVSKVSDPLRWAAKPVSAATEAGSQWLANKLYTSALKPSSRNPIATMQEIAQTGRQALLDPTDTASYTKLQGLMADLRSKIAAGIQQRAGATIDPQAVAQRVEDVRPAFQTVNPVDDLRALDRAKQEFLNQFTVQQKPSGLLGPTGQPLPTPAPQVTPIPIEQAQDLKTRTNALLAAKYGQMGPAEIEAQKALVRGLKEEVEGIFPEIGPMNEQLGKYMALDPDLEAAIKRNMKGDFAKVSTLKTILDNAAVKTKIALAMEKAYQRTPGQFESMARTVGGRMQIVDSRIKNFLDRMDAAEAQDQGQYAAQPVQ